MRELTVDGFEGEVYWRSVPVAVFFGAPWCPECQALTPTWEALEKLYGEHAGIYHVDLEAWPRFRIRYNIHSVPQVMYWPARTALPIDQRTLGNQPLAVYAKVLDFLRIWKGHGQMNDQERYIAWLESVGYTRVMSPTSLGGLSYLIDEAADKSQCVIIGDGGGCAGLPAQRKGQCHQGCCCLFCFDSSGKFLGHCCCQACPPITKAKA